METEKGILIRLDREIQKMGDNIETLKSFDSPKYIIAAYSQIRENKIKYKNELLNSL